MITSGLSLDQAPPFGVVAKFFIIAPIFAILAGVFIFLGGADLLLNRYHEYALITTHLLTLGVMGTIMTGALFQMLPVIAGVVVPYSKLLGYSTFYLLISGTLFLISGFAFHTDIFFVLAGFLLFFAFLPFIVFSLRGLFSVEFSNVTVKLMKLSLIALLVTLLLGIHLVVSNIFGKSGTTILFTNLHASFGLAGWATLLILGVAQQVLPMFYITPRYPKFCRTVTGPLIFISLFVAGLLSFFDLVIIAKIGVAIGFSMLGTMTFARTLRRKRKAADGSLRYWQFSALSITLSLLFLFIENEYARSIFYILFAGGFVLGVINAMLYKIVPFLAWFHLSATFRPDLPTMHDFIPRKAVFWQLYLFASSLALLIVGLFVPIVVKIGAILFIASYLLLLKDITKALIIYKRNGGVF